MSAAMSFAAHAPGLVLFAEDFDIPATNRTVPEPEIIEPSFSQADLESVRQQAWKAGHEAAATAADQAHKLAVREIVAAIAAQLSDARAQAEAAAQQAADELARLLLDSFAAVLPAFAARHGPTELRGLIRTLLPALSHEPSVSIRLNPACTDAVAQEIERFDPDLIARLQIVACDTVQPGDIRVVWQGGQAVRDIAELWRQVAEILAPAGLLSFAATKEVEHVE